MEEYQIRQWVHDWTDKNKSFIEKNDHNDILMKMFDDAKAAHVPYLEFGNAFVSWTIKGTDKQDCLGAHIDTVCRLMNINFSINGPFGMTVDLLHTIN